MTGTMDIRRLLSPQSVAVVGASPEERSVGGAILRNLRQSGFNGELTLVSRSKDEIDGQPCVKSLLDIPQGTDLVILNVPRLAITQSIEDCITRGVGGVVVFAAGFSEVSEEGRLEQEALAARCCEADLALLGPNCMGFTNYREGVAASFEALQFRAGPPNGGRDAAVLAQSGAMASNLRAALDSRGLNITHVIATGNEAVLHAEDFIDVLIDDGVGLISIYAEQIRNPSRFLEATARAWDKNVPIILMHPGRSARARAAAQSHTGALTGDYAIMKTLSSRAGVVVVGTMDEALDTAVILERCPRPHSGRAGVVTNSGALRGLALDSAEDTSLALAEPSAATTDILAAAMPDGMEVDNPYDVGIAGYADASVFTQMTSALLADEDVGAVILPLVGGGPAQQRAKAEALLAVEPVPGKPVVLTIVGDELQLDPEFLETVRQHRIPFFRSPDRTFRAMAAVSRFANSQRKDAAPLSDIPLLNSWGSVPEYTGKEWLRELGIAVPDGRLALSHEEAQEVAAKLGYPLVLKAQASTLLHKSDAGGVIVGIGTDEELTAAWDQLHQNIKTAQPDVELDGVLVEQMAAKGLELIVGAKRDPDWGPVLLVGLGGVWTEALDAVEILPADVTREEVLQQIGKMKGHKLLGAFRGQPARDVEALADVVVKIGEAMRADPAIQEIDINPVIVFAEGEGAVALDALIIREPD